MSDRHLRAVPDPTGEALTEGQTELARNAIRAYLANDWDRGNLDGNGISVHYIGRLVTVGCVAASATIPQMPAVMRIAGDACLDMIETMIEALQQGANDGDA